MNVHFYKFTKRLNSTKQPPVTQGINVECQLKDECSFLNPVLKISKDIVSGVFSPAEYNYCQIAYWGRYYYITDWEYKNGIWEANLTVDPLASFKAYIGATNAYVIRSSASYNGAIIDGYYPTTTTKSINKVQIFTDWFRKTLTEGCYVLGVVNNGGAGVRVGSVSYYALSNTEIASLMAYLFSDNIFNMSSIDEIGEGLYKSMFDPFQYIVSCMWFPIPKSELGSTTQNIKVGYWETSVTGTVCSTLIKQYAVNSNTAIPRHPQSNRGEYLNFEPYTKLTAYIPPFGEIPIDTSFCQYNDNNWLNGWVFIDFLTGIADLYIGITNGLEDTANRTKYVTMRSSQLGVPIQLSQVMTDYLSTAGSIGGAISSIFSGNIGGIFSNIVSGVQNAMPKISNLGSNGSFLEVVITPYLIVEFNRLVNEDLSEHGRPLCQIKKLSDIAGFIQCGDDDYQFPCTKTETEEICRNMKNGFFYE